MTTPYDLAGKRVFVAGDRGMVGSSLVRRLRREGCTMLTAARDDLDLRRQEDVQRWMAAHRPHAVFLAAGKVGGILANSTLPVQFLDDNLLIASNVIRASHGVGVEKLLFLGSSCIYPRLAPQPLSEDALLTGPLEPTNAWYAIAKIAGLKLCQAYRRQYGCDYISAMPTNLYGPGDNYDPQEGHVLPALLRKLHEAKATRAETVTVWGSGRPLREFLHVDDLADACVFLMRGYSGDSHVNVGSGRELSIRELAEFIAEVIGWSGRIVFDGSKPDGTPRKLLDSSRLHGMGWRARTDLRDGVADAYAWFLAHGADARRPPAHAGSAPPTAA